MNISEKQTTAMKLLATYKFLTSSQFVNLGLYETAGSVTKILKELADMDKPFVDKVNPASNVKDGRLPSLYYLTKYGVDYLISNGIKEENIKYQAGVISSAPGDYFHKCKTIDFHIELRKWLEANSGKILFIDYYFDKKGNNRSGKKEEYVEAQCSIKVQEESEKSIIPDLNVQFEINDTEYLFLFEQHNGQDSKRLMKDLALHLIAINQNSASKKYNFERSNRVAVVCEHEGTKNATIERLKKISEFNLYHQYFIFKTNQELENDFFDNWTLINGDSVNFIGKSL